MSVPAARRSSARRSGSSPGPAVAPRTCGARCSAAGPCPARSRPPRGADGDGRGRRVHRRHRDRAGVPLRVLDKGRHAVAYAKGTEPIADALAAAGASDAVLALEERVVMGATKAVRTGSRTRITRISCGRAGRRRSRSARCAGWSGAGARARLPPKLREIAGCGSAIPRFRCASWRSDAARLRRNPRYNGAFRASSGSPGCRAVNQ